MGFKILFGCSLFLIIIAAIISYFIYDYTNTTTSINNVAIEKYSPKKEIVFEVKAGQTVQNVIDSLESENLISNKLYFQIYSKLNAFDTILAGKYLIKPGANFKEIIESLKIPQILTIKLSFYEGLRIDEIADKIDAQIEDQIKDKSTIKFSKTEFLEIANNPSSFLDHELLKIIPEGKTLEGLLYPDTYIFEKEATTKEVILKLLDTFNEKLTLAKVNSSLTPGVYTDYELVTLASIVEKEGTGIYEDNANIADVFFKRLQGLNGAKLLQSDVVLLYELKNWKAVLTFYDLENKNYEYNTHVKEGLPPGPICSIGLNSLKAVYSPISNDYLYFIADLEGNLHFAKDYQEHLENVEQYLNN